MFDLDQQIANWKSDFARKAKCSNDELLELESHLCEVIAVLVAAGCSEQAAFRESVARLGDPISIGREFAKNESRFVWDGVALQGNGVVVILIGLAAIVLGFVVGIHRGDGLLGGHLGTISFAYLIPFLLAAVGTYAIFRGTLVQSDQTQFRDRFAAQCRLLLGVVALVSATGVILGGVWAERHLGRFWGWDAKEIGGLAVVVAALVLYRLLTRRKPGTVQLGQAGVFMSLVTLIAWFGPAVYLESVGPSVVAILGVCLFCQLAVLSIGFVLSKRDLA